MIPIDDEYYVRLKYNGKTIPFCPNENNFKGMYCPFSVFLQTAQEYFLFPDFDKFCGNEEVSVKRTQKVVVKKVVYEEAERYLVYGNIWCFILLVVSIIKVRCSTKSKVEKIIADYENIQIGKKKKGGLPAGANLQSLDTQEAGHADPFNVEKLDGDVTMDEEEEKRAGDVMMSERQLEKKEGDEDDGDVDSVVA